MAYTLRVSVIDNCQLRCGYCLPHGVEHPLKKHHYLTIEQYEKIARVLAELQIEKIRFTGGEPLLRKDLPDIIAAFAKQFSVQLALTTNGLRFKTMKNALVQAGLGAVTFHLDTLKEERYAALMGNGDVATVMTAIDEAQRAGLGVKLNVVVQKGINDDELIDFLHYSRRADVEVRFIEQMNTGSAKEHVAQTFISGKDILLRIANDTPIGERMRIHPNAPAEQFFAEDLGVAFGLIASDTRPFCAACNRLRLSADGRMRTCLYEPFGKSLNLHEPINDDVLLENIRAVVAQKRSFHPALKAMREDFSMASVGG